MENSSFGEVNESIISDIQELKNNGATSDTFKVSINGKWFFLKRPKKEFGNHPKYIAAFEKEFEIGSTLNHPNIVKYIDKNEDENGLYILTEYVEGLTLKDFLEQKPDYFHHKKNLKKFANQLLAALEYLHQRQILHLDLKPENILITTIDHNVKIIDLGFSYSDTHQFSTSGKSNQYASPEQLNGEANIDQQADIYSFGLLMLYAHTRTINKNLLHKPPQPYRNCIAKCLETDKSKRFKNVSSIKDYLQQKIRQKRILVISSLLVLLIAFAGIVQYTVYKKTTIDITKIDAPADIMQRVDVGTSIAYIKEHWGQPLALRYSEDNAFYYWSFKNAKLSIKSEKETAVEVGLYIDNDNTVDYLYDSVLENYELPPLGKLTVGDLIEGYDFFDSPAGRQYLVDKDKAIGGMDGAFYFNFCMAEACIDGITIVFSPNKLTNYETYEFTAYEYYTQLPYDIQRKLVESDGMEGTLNEKLTKEDKKRILDVFKTIKIRYINHGFYDFYDEFHDLFSIE